MKRQTLDAKHNNILNSFTENKQTLNVIYKELEAITIKIKELNIQNNKYPILNINLQQEIWIYEDKKTECEKEIKLIENNIDENELYVKNW